MCDLVETLMSGASRDSSGATNYCEKLQLRAGTEQVQGDGGRHNVEQWASKFEGLPQGGPHKFQFECQ